MSCSVAWFTFTVGISEVVEFQTDAQSGYYDTKGFVVLTNDERIAVSCNKSRSISEQKRQVERSGIKG